MKDFIEKVSSLPHFSPWVGVNSNKINEAEEALNLSFSEEYKALVSQFGVVSVKGHELTGLCEFNRLNVVPVTLEARRYNPDAPLDFYVVEEANLDSIVIWQSPSGEIYLSKPGSKLIKTHDSLLAYLTSDLDDDYE